MISDFILNGLEFLIKGGQRLWVSIYTWHDSKAQVVISNSELTWVIVMTTVLSLTGQPVCKHYQMFRSASDPNEPFKNYLKMAVQRVTRIIAIVIEFDGLIDAENKKTIANKILLLNKRNLNVKQTKRKLHSETSTHLKKWHRTISNLTFLSLSIGCVHCRHSFGHCFVQACKRGCAFPWRLGSCKTVSSMISRCGWGFKPHGHLQFYGRWFGIEKDYSHMADSNTHIPQISCVSVIWMS